MSVSPMFRTPAAGAGAGRSLRHWQIQVFLVSWITYAAYYFPRSAFSAAKVGILEDPAVSTVLTKQVLGNLDALYLAAYAIGQFVWGAVAERWGTRVVVTCGMIMAGLAAVFMGLSTALWLFAPLMIVQGLAQATGWAALSKNIASFFTVARRGRVMGLFSTSYAFGGLVAAPVAGWIAYSVFDSWRVAFFAGGGIILALLVLFIALQRNSLRECGLPDIDVIDATPPGAASAQDPPAEPAPQRRRVRPADLLAAARHDPMVLRLGLSYFLLKPARYAILLWGPVLVLEAMPGVDKVTAILVPVAFGIAGLVAPIALGWLSDTAFDARRVPVCVLSLVMPRRPRSAGRHRAAAPPVARPTSSPTPGSGWSQPAGSGRAPWRRPRTHRSPRPAPGPPGGSGSAPYRRSSHGAPVGHGAAMLGSCW